MNNLLQWTNYFRLFHCSAVFKWQIYINILEKTMNTALYRPSNFKQVPVKMADRVLKIRQLIDRALTEVHDNKLRTSSLSPFKHRSDESSEAESIQQILANLRRGYLMVKHSENSSQPHNKFVYLSEGNRYLSWKSIDKEDEKKIELSSTVKVVKEGVQFYLKGNQIKNIDRCIVVISSHRNLQLQAKTQMEAVYFKYQIERTIKYSGCMHLNYKYSQ